MPIRRPSASVGHSNNAGSARVHKSTDSHHAFVATSSSQQHSLLSLGASATPQQKIVQVLVNRLKHKLPCNSGLSLDRVEADNPTQQAIETLVELSHDSLDMIAWALSEMRDAANGPKFWTLFHRGSTISALRSQGVVHDHGVTLESRSSVSISCQ